MSISHYFAPPANVAYSLFHYFHKTCLIIFCITKNYICKHGLAATAMLSQPGPTGNTITALQSLSTGKNPIIQKQTTISLDNIVIHILCYL